MKILVDEKSKVLAENNGWPLEQTKGFVDGEIARRRSESISQFVLVGMDDYSAGYRAGYFDRRLQGLNSRAESRVMSERAPSHAQTG